MNSNPQVGRSIQRFCPHSRSTFPVKVLTENNICGLASQTMGIDKPGRIFYCSPENEKGIVDEPGAQPRYLPFFSGLAPTGGTCFFVLYRFLFFLFQERPPGILADRKRSPGGTEISPGPLKPLDPEEFSSGFFYCSQFNFQPEDLP